MHGNKLSTTLRDIKILTNFSDKKANLRAF